MVFVHRALKCVKYPLGFAVVNQYFVLHEGDSFVRRMDVHPD